MLRSDDRRYGAQWIIGTFAIALFVTLAGRSLADPPKLQPTVEVEEAVYSFSHADNGAGPMWCSGSTCIVRGPFGVVASGLETIAEAKPLNNVRWTLFQRAGFQRAGFQHAGEGWKQRYVDAKERTREPCPLATFHGGPLFLSANPTLAKPDDYSGPARPEVLQIDLAGEEVQFKNSMPKWRDHPPFTEHSYRSFAADGKNRELVLFQNIGYAHAEWAFRDASGAWSAAGQLKWPWGADYEKPQPIRTCYPTVMLKNRAVHFCGVSDIVEPNSKWRAYKKQLTGRSWDYDFRRLFYTWSDDISAGKFHPWVEIASREETCGWIRPCDLWVDDDQRVHILWTETALSERLRTKFFPDAKQSHALNYAIVKEGKVIHKRALVLAQEGGSQEKVGFARFQVTESGRLFVFYYVSGTGADHRKLSENRVMELHADATVSDPVTIALKRPMVQFFTATVRGGSPRSHVIDLLGQQAQRSGAISYARVRLW